LTLAPSFSFAQTAVRAALAYAGSEIIRIYEFLGTLESAFPWLAIFLSRGKRRGEFNFTDTPRLHSYAYTAVSGSIVRGLYFRRAFLLFIDMRAGKKARQRVKNTHAMVARKAHTEQVIVPAGRILFKLKIQFS